MADTPPPTSAARRIGMRDVAKAANVSLMTVSLALHNNPKISVETRRRVRAIAEKIGYSPDPELSRLMGKLRPSRFAENATLIALIDLRNDLVKPQHPYNIGLRRGITARAQQLGFGLSEFRLEDYQRDIRPLIRVMRQRGINGAILLPAEKPLSFPRQTKWDGLSIVSATTSVLYPRFHRVAPDQMHNILMLLDDLSASGFARIGLVVSDDFEERSAHYYSLAVGSRGNAGRVLIVPALEPGPAKAARFRSWLRRQRPDVILAQDPEPIAAQLAAEKKSGGRSPELVSLSTRFDQRFPYLDELPETIGGSAVDLIAGMMFNHETGIPQHPRVTTTDGVFERYQLRRRPDASA